MLYYTFFTIFIVVFIIETIVTGAVIMHRQRVQQLMNSWMKWWAIASMTMISASNLLGLLWLKHNNDLMNSIDRGNWIQLLFAISTASLFLWVLVFHRRFLKK